MTVSDPNTARPPGICARPSGTRRSADNAVMFVPSNSTTPDRGSTWPAMTFKAVDLPAPFVPRRATISP